MYYFSFTVSILMMQMQPMMQFVDVGKHDCVSVFSKALVHFLPHQRTSPQ